MAASKSKQAQSKQAQARASQAKAAQAQRARTDRNRRPAEQSDQDMYLHVVGRRKDGMVVRGAKMHTSGGVVAEELVVIAQRAMRALSSPAGPLPAKSGEGTTPNYKPGDRRDMDRLIENAR